MPVSLYTDQTGVPHIYAENETDLYFAQGYVTARLRLWQLEMTRRTAAGRLSEVFGPRCLAGDQFQRSLGLSSLVQEKKKALSTDVERRLSAYVRGINARVAEHGPSPEYQEAGVEFEPWDAADVLLAIELRSTINASWRADLVQLSVMARLPLLEAAKLFPFSRFSDGEASETAPGPLDAELCRSILTLTRSCEQALSMLGLDDIDTGSNAWVVSGRRSRSGKPILANDLHMGYVVPNPNFIVHLVAPGINVRGISFPGLPGVASGHNAEIAWGTTALMADAQDVFLERLSEDGSCYLVGGEWRPLHRISESIAVRGREPVVHSVEHTEHGALVAKSKGWALALRTERMETPPGDPSCFALNTARDWTSFKRALENPALPPTDFVYADVEGNIGSKSTGLLPLRRGGDGSLPLVGSEEETGWRGFLPFEELPEAINPASGYIVRANQNHLREAYPHPLSRRWHPPYRARRVVERLLERDQHGVASMAAIQADRVWIHGLYLRDLLVRSAPWDESESGLCEQLAGWDGELAPDSAAGAVVKEFSSLLRRRLLEPLLGKRLLFDYQRYWPTGSLAVELILNEEDPFFLPREVPSYRELIATVFREAVANLTRDFGEDELRWRWGSRCPARFRHTLEALGGSVAEKYRVESQDLGSDGECVSSSRSVSDYISSQQNQALDGNGGPAAIFGASARMVWDLGDLDSSSILLNLGQSGEPTSPRYRDHAASFASGRMLAVPFTEAAVRIQAEEILALRPALVPVGG
jgi:penicillin amidase